jgi:hypothetical protein
MNDACQRFDLFGSWRMCPQPRGLFILGIDEISFCFRFGFQPTTALTSGFDDAVQRLCDMANDITC